MAPCIFCQIAQRQAPAHIIWEDKDYLAFLSIYPNTEGFSVVIPKKHYPGYAFHIPDEVLSGLVIAAKKVGKLLDQKLEDVGRTGMMFEGFQVDHAHAKLFPMHGTDTKAGTKKAKPIISKVNKFFKTYEGYLSSHNGPRADDQTLATLAKKIRE